MGSGLIEFYRGDGVDSEGRRLEEILSWDFIRLEIVHDFIQWLFPLDEPSQFNDDAPILTREQMQLFRKDPQLRDNVLRSFQRMLSFYGFALGLEPKCEIAESDLFLNRQHVLYSGFNHNHLRITRFLRSLSLFGLPDLARLFLQQLIDRDRGNSLPPESLQYWKAAIIAVE